MIASALAMRGSASQRSERADDVDDHSVAVEAG